MSFIFGIEQHFEHGPSHLPSSAARRMLNELLLDALRPAYAALRDHCQVGRIKQYQDPGGPLMMTLQSALFGILGGVRTVRRDPAPCDIDLDEAL